MKILVLTGNIYLPAKPFNKSKNGFGYTVGSFCQNMATKHDVYLLTQSHFTKERDLGNIHIVKKNIWDLLFSCSLKYIVLWWKETHDIPLFSKMKYRALLYYFTGSYAERMIRVIKPDIINVKGVHIPTSPFLSACKDSSIPWVVSLHGLNSFNKELDSSESLIKLERKYLMEINDSPVTVISSGIKKRIENYVGRRMPNIRVILNGVQEICKKNCIDYELLQTLGIPAESNVLISVSSINENKNQIQVIEAIGLMPEEMRRKTYYLICGVGDYETEIIGRAVELGVESNIKLCGYVNNSDIWRYYSIATVNMMVSFSEGFGRSVIEGYMCGIPVVIYSDLDACEDITNPNTAIVVNERSEKALMEGIIKALGKSWNKEEIIDYSKQFSDEKMTYNYEKFFEEILQKQ